MRGFTGSLPWALALLGAAAALSVRAPLGVERAEMGEREEFRSLPPAAHLKIMSGGYVAATADFLFSSTLVHAGRAFVNKRPFDALGEYLFTVVRLDPSFRDVYLYADSLLTLSTAKVPPGNYRIARNLLEYGLAEFPDDAELWYSTAQFLLYLAPPHLPESERKEEWKAAGARAMQRACQLMSDAPPPGCLSSIRTLAVVGEAQAGIESLRRMLALTSDLEMRAKLEAELGELVSVREQARINARTQALSELHRSDLPLATRGQYQILGPRAELRCFLADDTQKGCATSFRQWGRQTEGQFVEP